jgi:prepilin-type N-terminal cleavage/methylation domain-containing protein
MNRHNKRTLQQGFTMIEVMVAFSVLAFGLLAVASFQTKLVSGSGLNKARSEAIALAQQKLDEIRSYTDEPTLVANLEGNTVVAGETFPDDVSDGNYPATAEPIYGVNASFSRRWNVAVSGNVADVMVTVSWDDPRQGAQSVSLDSAVTWKNPRGGADLTDMDDPLVPSATGRAHLGEGHIDPADIPDGADNHDGTSSVDFDNDDDLELIDNATGDVVLTLEKACNAGVCTDFVKISGRLYIDKAASSMTTSDVYVLASDAAYCARDLVNAGTTTPNGNYDYYDYTCYLGGGWHGNIGILMDGGPHDTACVGDPDADLSDGTDNWKRYELAKRRVYRGMLYKIDDDGAAITDGGGDTLYYSQGIADAITLPDPAWPARYYGHDFVVTRVTNAAQGGGTAADCLSSLTRADAVAANLFQGVSSDFVCLNSDSITNDYADGVDPNSYSPYLDNFPTDDGATYRAGNDCPFDPSDPPSNRFVISGTIATPSLPASMLVVTSDGTDNCTWTIGASSTSYSCDVYAWEDANGVISGWDGAINLYPPADMLCAVAPVDGSTVYTNSVQRLYSDVIADAANQDYACSALASMSVSGTISAPGSDLAGGSVSASDDSVCTYTSSGETATYQCTVIEPTADAGWTGTITFTPPASMPAGVCSPTEWSFSTPLHEASTGNDSTCSVPQTATITGALATTSAVDLSAMQVSADGTTCPISEVSGAYSYTCTVVHYGSGWNGTLTTNSGDPDIRCLPESTSLSNVTGAASGPDVSCEVDYGGEVIVSGFIRVYDLSRTQPTTPVISAGSCILNNGATLPSSGTYRDISYSCTTPRIDHGATWSGSVTFGDTANKVICTDATHPNPREFTDIAPRTVLDSVNVLIEKNAASCGTLP